MRFFWSILAIMILVLGCIPCSDAEACTVLQAQAAYTVKGHAGETTSQGREHEDLCSPFCQCACCAMAYTLPHLTLSVPDGNAAAPQKSFAFYLQQKPSGIIMPIWQPPQLV